MHDILLTTHQPEILRQTLKARFVPGTNLTGGLASASWRFLLPTLQPKHVLFLGAPSMPTLEIFAGMSQLVLVAVPQAAAAEALEQDIEKRQLRNVHVLAYHFGQRLPLKDRVIDLMVLSDGFDLQTVKQDNLLLTEIARLLHDRGTLYFEVQNVLDRASGQMFLKLLKILGVSAYRAFWVTPFRGELRTAFPLHDDSKAEQLFSAVLYGQSVKNRLASRLGQMMSRARLATSFMPRRAVLVQRGPMARKLDSPPHYLVQAAWQSGIDIDGMRYWLSARGKYNSNKTIFFLYRKSRAGTQIVVKMTRAPEFNHRLENEFRVLQDIRQRRLVKLSTVPEPLFLGHHAGLAILGQGAVQGKPFRSRTRATVDCPVARNAIVWIEAFGKKSAQDSDVPASAVGEILAGLFRRFADVYRLDGDEYEFLQAQVDRMRESDRLLPLVFFHGDLGTWNILVADVDDRAIVIDWEAGDPNGLPLWDMFYFLRSYGNWMYRKKGKQDAIGSFREAFFTNSEIGAHFVSVVKQYCDAVGLEPQFAEPLFYTCWMHRALKESARLTPDTLDSGRFIELLRFSMQHRASLEIARL